MPAPKDLPVEGSQIDFNDGPMAKLFRGSEIEAEYTIGWARIAAGVVLIVTGIFFTTGAVGRGETNLLNYYTGLATMGAFILLGIVSWFLAASRHYNKWFAFILVTCDAIIVGVSLYVAMSNNGLGGNWISAMPVIWAAPLMLAVGALRYRPAVQVWATISMIGAITIVALMLGVEPSPESLAAQGGVEERISRLYALPPNIIRELILLLLGMTTALVMVRARRLLVRALNEAAQRANLARFLPSEIAPLLGGGDLAALREGRRQIATVMFVDIRGSTALAEQLDPARLSIFISSFRRRVMRASREFGGVVDKFIGDGALIVFGVPTPAPDDAARAIACARRILEHVEQWNRKRNFDPPVRVGIGLHTGEVYWGLIGDDQRLELTVLGDTVNVAAKLEQATKKFDTALLASGETIDQAGERAVWSVAGEAPLGGRGEKTELLKPLPH